jgi:hypothetical protein
MKTQYQPNASTTTVKLPAFTIQTGTEASSGPREGVVGVFANPPLTVASKSSPKSLKFSLDRI